VTLSDERVTRRRGLPAWLLQDYSEAVIARIFHAVVEEIESFDGAAIAVFRTPLPLEVVLPACYMHGMKFTDTHIVSIPPLVLIHTILFILRTRR
jgi:hypothetical protein